MIYKNVLSDNENNTGQFSNRVIIYDTLKDGCFESTNLVCKINVPDYIVNDDKIYLLGGECEKFKLGDEYFGRHSDMFTIGSISVTKD
jgi:hypothetical protein